MYFQTSKINVFLALQYPLFSEVIETIFSITDDIEVCGVEPFVSDLPLKLAAQQPDVLFLDMQFLKGENSISLAHIQEISPRTGIVVLSEYAEPATAMKIMEQGAYAYLLKDSKSTTIIKAARFVHQQKRFIDKRLISQIDYYQTVKNNLQTI